jgi:hypothetical protein
MYLVMEGNKQAAPVWRWRRLLSMAVVAGKKTLYGGAGEVPQRSGELER